MLSTSEILPQGAVSGQFVEAHSVHFGIRFVRGERRAGMQLSAVLAFAAIAFTLIAVPGPDWAYVLAAGARDHVVLPVVGGVMAGYVILTAIMVAGVGPLVAAAPATLTALTIAGSAYLVHLGIRVLARPGGIERSGATGTALAASRLGYLRRGMGVSALNPKGLLIFLSILPQFTRSENDWPLPMQLGALGIVFVLICAVVYIPLGHAADRVLGARPGIARRTTQLAGATMIVVGLALLGERIIETS
ncbi:LysE family translocator [Micromonospora sp. NPDC050686]|uniref:LysE family translocator n=1 Tax=Micromonospora sp. NPDC050686 TaxID=3154631 RepID=UPI0034029919